MLRTCPPNRTRRPTMRRGSRANSAVPTNGRLSCRRWLDRRWRRVSDASPSSRSRPPRSSASAQATPLVLTSSTTPAWRTAGSSRLMTGMSGSSPSSLAVTSASVTMVTAVPSARRRMSELPAGTRTMRCSLLAVRGVARHGAGWHSPIPGDSPKFRRSGELFRRRKLQQAGLMYYPAMSRRQGHGEPAPPGFLGLAGHPVRWRLVSELALGDRQVHELAALVGQAQSLVSYHLGKLRKASLVTTRRSTADGRDTYYSLDLALCGQLLAGAGGALHPALLLTPPASPAPRGGQVLFLCTGNSSRSQMAEALLLRAAGGAVRAFRAGSHPKQVHRHAIEAMAEHGMDLTAARAKHLDEFAGRRFDY